MTYSLALAVGEHERGRALAEGRVPIPGFDLQVATFSNDGERHDRFLRGEFDSCELSLAIATRTCQEGGDYKAIPVFPNRRFRHSFIYINKGAGIRRPKDLEGKRVGVAAWVNTAGVWVRGLLADDYGVDISEIEWSVRSELEPDICARLGTNVNVVRRESKASPVEMLIDGALDALIVPSAIKPIWDPQSSVARLFPDYRAVERSYFERTKILPISHAVVIRRSYLEQHPESPTLLLQAWEQSKAISRAYSRHAGHSNLLWYGSLQEEETQLFGVDPWTYSIEPNRTTLETFLGYAATQGLIDHGVTIKDLFVPGLG